MTMNPSPKFQAFKINADGWISRLNNYEYSNGNYDVSQPKKHDYSGNISHINTNQEMVKIISVLRGNILLGHLENIFSR